jgi:hypothetical protein
MSGDDQRTAQNIQNMIYQIGDLIVRWNTCEGSLRHLLAHVSGGGVSYDILAAHMTPTALLNAIRTFGNDVVEAPFDEHIEHAAEFFDRLRMYRNYYVHGIHHITADAKGDAVGLANELSARGRLVLHPKEIRIGELIDLMAKMAVFHTYLYHLIHLFQWTKDKTFRTFEEFQVPPEKPTLPPKLQKPKLYPLDEEVGRGR